MIKQHQSAFIADDLEIQLVDNQYTLISYSYYEGVAPEVFTYSATQPIPPAEMLVLSDEMPF